MFLICYVQILYSLFHNHTRSTCFFSIFFKIQQIVYLLHTGSCFGLMKSSILQGIASTGFVDLAPLQIDLLHPHLSLSSGQQIQFFDAWIAEHEMCSSFVYVEKVCFFGDLLVVQVTQHFVFWAFLFSSSLLVQIFVFPWLSFSFLH